MKEFETQICTTIEQSQRPLDLGLKPETADCTWAIINGEPVSFTCQTKIDCSKVTINGNEMAKKEIIHCPAWSLHRLIVLLNPQTVEFAMSTIDGAYEDVIYNISTSIKRGIFNKEYLKS